ncbi:MAG: hypothetical protein R3B53_01950 [Candidatus Paceibacterota bacterium]
MTAPAQLSISGNYTNNGAFITATTSTTTFSGTTAQTIAGKATGTSAFANTVFTGSGTKTFASTSMAANNFVVESASGEVIVPESLTLTGNYINNSTTTHGGAKWTLGLATTTTLWAKSVVYGNGRFVAVVMMELVESLSLLTSIEWSYYESAIKMLEFYRLR